MTYASTSDLVNVTGSAESSTVLQAILTDAEREVNAYLKARGVTASSNDATISAELKLGHAGLLMYALQSGKAILASGEMVSGVDQAAAWNIPSATRMLREQAFEILDNYVAVQSSLNTPRARFLMKVN